MIWVVFRHGEKSLEGFDPGLSPRGLEQAEKVFQKVKAGQLPKPTALFVSTKKRSAQTFGPLSANAKIKAQIRAELTERVPGETREKFRLRIQEFLLKLMLEHKETDVIYLCTHSDWIDEFLTMIECDSDLSRCHYWPSAQHMVFDKKEIWHLLKYEGL